MKYETLSESKDITSTTGTTHTFTFTFSNNIDHIVALYSHHGNASTTASPLNITSVTISGNVLSIVYTAYAGSGVSSNIFVLATVASY